MSLASERDDAIRLVAQLFKNPDGNPFIMTEGQADIFNVIFLKKNQNNLIIAPTRYGKSDIESMAIATRSMTFAEPFTVLAPSEPKTQIIMGKLISHIYDNPFLEQQIDHTAIPQIERLKHKRNVDHITWLRGGEVRTLSADSRNRKRVKEALTGFGAANLIIDESGLIPDDIYAMAKRMLGDRPDYFLVEISNPFFRNHLYKAFTSETYNKIWIDYNQGLREGRYSPQFIEEMRQQPFFRELYECLFPDRDEILVDGYRHLIDETVLESAFCKPGEIVPEGIPRLGVDFAGGGNDRSAYVVRYDNLMKLVHTNHIADTMQQIPLVEDYAQEYQVKPEYVFLDTGGLGQGIGDRLHEKDFYSNNIMFGERALQPELYKNRRAEMYYLLKEWLEAGGRIEYDDAWYELLSVNYKTDSERKFQIQPKIDLKKIMREMSLTVTSPDVADAAVLTFGEGATITEEDFEFI